MSALLELDESNGAVEVVTHGVGSLAMGTDDATGMTPGAPGARQGASTSSMQKALRIHLTNLGGWLGIEALRVYCDPSATGWTLWTNATDDAGDYATSQITTYVPPSSGAGAVPHALPVSDPGQPNLGIGGDLEGTLSAPGQSDYLYIQLRADGTVASGFQAPLFLAYDRVG